MHNNSRGLSALLGVFSRPGFLRVGTAEDPVPYTDKQLPDRDAYKGAQFRTEATKIGKLPKELFDKEMRPLFQDEKYVDRWAWAETGQEKVKGFGTGDYSKRDEFALAIRCEQHRQQLKHEARVAKEAVAKLSAKGGAAAKGAATKGAAAKEEQKAKKPLLFDLVFDEGEQDFDQCIKAKRDTRNPTLLSPKRRYGALKTTALLAQQDATALPAPAAATSASA